jgi:putative hydrolase of the HAD superfamily
LTKGSRRLTSQLIDELDAFYIADDFINLPAIQNDLQSAKIELEMGEITSFTYGYRISFRQMATCENNLFLPVHGGAIHLFMNKRGEIFSLSSTLQYGLIQSQTNVLTTKKEAIQLASASCKYSVVRAWADLLLVEHNDEIKLAYEVTLVCQSPNKSYGCFVLTDTREIIEQRQRALEFHTGTSIAALVKGQALLTTPHPDKPISEQISKVIVKDLPNPQVLRNDFLNMFTNKQMVSVYAKADGSFCYGPSHNEFAAVSVFLSLQNQIDLYLQSGMVQPNQALTVVVNDSGVKDNAYFDPLNYEIHLGVGTGLEQGGLTEHIAYDLGVANHEFGHAIAYWQSVNNDLAGAQGAALNEAIGDVMGALVMDYLSNLWYPEKSGCRLTKRRLKNDARVIGKYALPPFGIRTQKNGCKAPVDLTGEPHSDGLIVGGALADCLIAMASEPGKDIEQQINLFVKINLMAVALLPGHRITFTDMLRALITADQQICSSKYRSTIERCRLSLLFNFLKSPHAILLLNIFTMHPTNLSQIIPNSEIKLLVFDMGGVFVRYEWQVICNGFAQATKLSPELFVETFERVNDFHYERGKITTAELVNRLNKAIGCSLTEEEFHTLWNKSLDEDVQMTKMFQDLRKQFPLYLLSNINDSNYTFLENRFNVSRHFNELILSHEVGYIKPEPEIYHEVLKRSGMQPHQCLFVDDLQPNVEGARAVGLNAFQFTGFEDLRSKFKDFGITV